MYDQDVTVSDHLNVYEEYLTVLDHLKVYEKDETAENVKVIGLLTI